MRFSWPGYRNIPHTIRGRISPTTNYSQCFYSKNIREHWDFIDLVGIMDIVLEQLHFNAIPDYSTVCKLSKRVSATVLNLLFRKVCSITTEWNNVTSAVAIDPSGFTPDSASTYYSIRMGKIRYDYLKTTISVDSDHISLVSFRGTNSRCHD